MDPINRLNRLMETLRQQMAQSTKRLNASPQTAQTGPTRPSTSPTRGTIQELRQHIGDRVRAIESDGPERGRRARRIFLESVLAWEFGDQLLLDSQFNRLIDGIQDAFESDPDINRELQNLLTELSQG